MKTIRVDEVGAIGDGVFDNSKIFQRALHELAETGSGTLISLRDNGEQVLRFAFELHLQIRIWLHCKLYRGV